MVRTNCAAKAALQYAAHQRAKGLFKISTVVGVLSPATVLSIEKQNVPQIKASTKSIKVLAPFPQNATRPPRCRWRH